MPRFGLGFALLAIAALPAAAQDSRREIRPEFDLYISHGEQIRFVFEDRLTEAPTPGYTQGNTSAAIEFALRPLFRRELRHQPDVFRNRYLTFRAAYEYIPNVNNGQWSVENRIVADTSAR